MDIVCTKMGKVYSVLFTLLFTVGLTGVTPVQLAGQDAMEQTINYDVRGEPLELVLDRLARDTGIDLVYDPDIVRGITIFSRAEEEELAAFLAEILSAHNLDYLTLSTGTIVIIKKAGEDPSYGSFSGLIVDRQSGEPLPGATVMLADASGGTSTGSSGRFSLNRLMSGEHTIIFSYVGYEPVTRTVRIPSGGQTREVIELRPKPVDVAPVVVEAHKPRFYGLNFRNPGDVNARQPGGGSRSIRDLHIVPGVQNGISMNDITLQGGQKSEHRVLLDGTPIYNPFAVGQMFSSFSPYAIGSVHLHRAGYGVEEGSQISGLMDLRHEVPENGENEWLVQADPMSVNLKGVISVEREERPVFSVMSAIRTNIWDVYKDPALESTLKEWDVIDPLITNQSAGFDGDAEFYLPADHRSDVSFYDIHTAARFQPDRFNTLGLTVYGGENSLDSGVLNRSVPGSDTEPYLYSIETYRWNNRMASLNWNSLPSARITLDTRLSYSRSDFAHGQDIGFGLPSRFTSTGNVSFDSGSESYNGFRQIALPSTIEGNQISHWIAKTDLSYAVNTGVELRGGARYDHVNTSVDIEEGTYLPTLASVSTSLLSGHSSVIIRHGSHWEIEAGTRFTYADRTKRVYAEPRASIQYDQASATPWSVKLSGGLYRQFINEYRISNTGATAVVPEFSVWSLAGDLPVPKAWHLNGSWHIEPTNRSEFRLEAYHKWQPVTAITSYQNLTIPGQTSRTDINAFATTTRMKAAGAGVRYGQQLAGEHLYLLLGYDYSYTRVDMQQQFNQTVPAPWSEPHRAFARLRWNPHDNLSVIGKWQGVMGRMWAYRDAYYNLLQQTGEPAYGDNKFDTPGNDTLAPFSQADIAFSYRPNLGSTNLEVRLDLINILNRKNSVDHLLVPVTNGDRVEEYEKRERQMPGFSPSLSIRLSI